MENKSISSGHQKTDLKRLHSPWRAMGASVACGNNLRTCKQNDDGGLWVMMRQLV